MKKILLLLLVCSVVFSLFACSSAGNDYAGDLNAYKITLTVSEDLKCVDLQEEITVKNKSGDKWDKIKLHLYANAYREDAPHRAYLKELVSYGGIEILSVKSGGKNLNSELKNNFTVLTVFLNEPLNPGESAVIDIEAVLTVPEANLRLGYCDGILNLGNFYPILAVYENGAFREDDYYKVGDPFYSEAADYEVRIVCKEDLVVAASGDERAETIDSGLKTIDFKAKSVRDFALAASYNFKEVYGLVGDTAIRYYYTGKNSPEALLDKAMDAFTAFKELIGGYPYKTYSIVETAFYYGGMEYPNLVFVNKNAADKESIIIHETAHQWFGCMVGSDSVNCSWLDEALVAFLSDYYYAVKGDRQKFLALRQSNKESYESFMKVQSLTIPEYSAKMDRPIYMYSNNYEYCMVVYTKGSLMFDAVYNLIGKKKFENSLRDYFERNKNKIASPGSLYSAFKSNKKDIEPIISAWLTDKVVVSGIIIDSKTDSV